MSREKESRLVCVTQRAACPGDFVSRMEAIIAAGPARVILREKDLSADDYRALAGRLLPLCRRYGVALTLRYGKGEEPLPGCMVQLPFPEADQAPRGVPFGVSVHAAEEAAALRNSAARYLIAGHIYPTACKADLPPRGLSFLKTVVEAAVQPVYAIGGVTPARVREVLSAGAAGYCVMNALMTTPDPVGLIQRYNKEEGAI